MHFVCDQDEDSTTNSFERRDGTHGAMMSRSVFALVRVYNLLPADVVAAKSVKQFQKLLTNNAKSDCVNSKNNWSTKYNPRTKVF